jgi:hypothetical protein
MQLPPAIFFINADISPGIKSVLTTQLFIDESMSGTEFDSRVSVDPNYPTIVHGNNLRILVIRESFRDYTNRELADVVLFITHGQAVVEKNNFGPPSLSLPISRLSIYDLLRFNNSSYVKILPNVPPKCSCVTTCGCGLGGIFAIQSQDTSGVHCPNPDNEYNNEDFINRK